MQALVNEYLGVTYQARGDYRQAIDYLRQTLVSLDGVGSHERFGRVFLPSVLSHAYLIWSHAELGMFAEGQISGRKGSELPRLLVSLEASWLPRGGSVCYSSAKATCGPPQVRTGHGPLSEYGHPALAPQGG